VFIIVAVAFAGNLALGQVPSLVGTKAGQVRDDNGLKMKLVWCPAGQFVMRSPKEEKGRDPSENQVSVNLSHGFWLGQTPVTQAQWQRVMPTVPWKGHMFVKEGNYYPATYVSYDDAMAFCEKLTQEERQAGRLPSTWRYTLPTETQWEYACRAGTTTRFSFGNNETSLDAYAWFDRNALEVNETYAHQVASKRANPWGLFDMHGSATQWCRNAFSDKTSDSGPDSRSGKSFRAVRGGDWSCSARGCRSAARIAYAPDDRRNALGFRVALESVTK
jgi:formylglycine-generating enzyme required for sulfatase activity